MAVTLRTKIEIAIGIVLFVACCFGADTWLHEHDARMKAESDAAAQQKIIQSNASQIKAIQAAEAARDEQTTKQVQSIAAAAAAQKTPQQIAAWIPKQMSTPAPITETIPAATPANPKPDAQFNVPQEDLPILRDDIAKCQECSVKLATAQQDLASKDVVIKKAGEDLSAAEKQRDDYKNALKGGTWLERLKHNSKFLAIGGAVAVGAVCATGHCKP